MTLQLHKSIEELYGDLLRMKREQEIAIERRTVCCRWCGKSKAKHLEDGSERCSVDAMSRVFMPDDIEDRKAVLRAIELIEELRAL